MQVLLNDDIPMHELDELLSNWDGPDDPMFLLAGQEIAKLDEHTRKLFAEMEGGISNKAFNGGGHPLRNLALAMRKFPQVNNLVLSLIELVRPFPGQVQKITLEMDKVMTHRTYRILLAANIQSTITAVEQRTPAQIDCGMAPMARVTRSTRTGATVPLQPAKRSAIRPATGERRLNLKTN